MYIPIVYSTVACSLSAETCRILIKCIVTVNIRNIPNILVCGNGGKEGKLDTDVPEESEHKASWILEV